MAEIRKRRKHEIPVEEEFASAFILSKWRGRKVVVEIPARRGINTRIESKQKSPSEIFRVIASKLCQTHPGISTDMGIFGGVPHIENVRLSVGDVLAKLYVYGSIQKVQEIYSPNVSEEQIKEAIAYAQDLLEIVCDPESFESDD